MINLCLVVIATQFSETKKRETERMLQERKRFQSCSTLASNSEPGGCYSELLKLLVQLWRQAKRKIIRGYRRTRGKKRQKINPEKSISLRRKRTKKKGTVQTIYIHPPPHQHYLHHHHHHHYHLNIVSPDRYPSRADSSPTAPRASPEASDVDPISSPRRPNFLMLPGNSYSLNPSSESLNTLALGAVEVFSPALFKSQQSTPNHLAALLPLTRTPSFNSSVTGRALASLPEVLAAHGAKNAALAASNMLLNSDTEPNKLQSVADKGKLGWLLAFLSVSAYHPKPLLFQSTQVHSPPLLIFCLCMWSQHSFNIIWGLPKLERCVCFVKIIYEIHGNINYCCGSRKGSRWSKQLLIDGPYPVSTFVTRTFLADLSSIFIFVVLCIFL